MLDISFPVFVVTIIVFLLLIAYLNAKLYKPLIAFMDKREAAIASDEKAADENLAQIGENKEQIAAIIAKARDEAGKLKANAIEEINSQSQKEISEKKERLESEMALFKKELEDEKEELKKNLMARVPEFKNSLKDSLSKSVGR